MAFFSILMIAIALAMDATAVSIAVGTTLSRWQPRSIIKLSFHFGLFQFMMPLLGWVVGLSVSSVVGRFDHWIAFALLTLVAAHLVYEAVCGEKVVKGDPTRGVRLYVLAVATSIDALAIGVTFVVLEVSVLYPCLVIGVVSVVMSMLGGWLGYKTKQSLGSAAKLFGAIILFAVGLRMLITHLLTHV